MTRQGPFGANAGGAKGRQPKQWIWVSRISRIWSRSQVLVQDLLSWHSWAISCMKIQYKKAWYAISYIIAYWTRKVASRNGSCVWLPVRLVKWPQEVDSTSEGEQASADSTSDVEVSPEQSPTAHEAREVGTTNANTLGQRQKAGAKLMTLVVIVRMECFPFCVDVWSSMHVQYLLLTFCQGREGALQGRKGGVWLVLEQVWREQGRGKPWIQSPSISMGWATFKEDHTKGSYWSSAPCQPAEAGHNLQKAWDEVPQALIRAPHVYESPDSAK